MGGARVRPPPSRYTPRVDLGAWGDHWYRRRCVNRELAAELTRIRSSGIPLGLLTNSVREWEPHRARILADGPPFDAFVRSHELGVAKPSPGIYRHAESLLPAAHGVPLLIDDVFENCAAASRRGWRAIHHVDTPRTLAALARELAPGRRGREPTDRRDRDRYSPHGGAK